MRYGKSQISLEYLIITGFVVCAIIIPSFLILFSSTSRGVQDTVSNQKTIDLGKGLVNDAKQMYYLGVYSRKISQYNIPDNVENMFILRIINDGKEYYYFGLALNDGKESIVQTFLSDIPLTSDLSENVQMDPSLDTLVKECTMEGYSCEFYSFTGPVIKPGNKRFKIETVWRSGRIESSITPILT